MGSGSSKPKKKPEKDGVGVDIPSSSCQSRDPGTNLHQSQSSQKESTPDYQGDTNPGEEQQNNNILPSGEQRKTDARNPESGIDYSTRLTLALGDFKLPKSDLDMCEKIVVQHPDLQGDLLKVCKCMEYMRYMDMKSSSESAKELQAIIMSKSEEGGGKVELMKQFMVYAGFAETSYDTHKMLLDQNKLGSFVDVAADASKLSDVDRLLLSTTQSFWSTLSMTAVFGERGIAKQILKLTVQSLNRSKDINVKTLKTSETFPRCTAIVANLCSSSLRQIHKEMKVANVLLSFLTNTSPPGVALRALESFLLISEEQDYSLLAQCGGALEMAIKGVEEGSLTPDGIYRVDSQTIVIRALLAGFNKISHDRGVRKVLVDRYVLNMACIVLSGENVVNKQEVAGLLLQISPDQGTDKMPGVEELKKTLERVLGTLDSRLELADDLRFCLWNLSITTHNHQDFIEERIKSQIKVQRDLDICLKILHENQHLVLCFRGCVECVDVLGEGGESVIEKMLAVVNYYYRLSSDADKIAFCTFLASAGFFNRSYSMYQRLLGNYKLTCFNDTNFGDMSKLPPNTKSLFIRVRNMWKYICCNTKNFTDDLDIVLKEVVLDMERLEGSRGDLLRTSDTYASATGIIGNVAEAMPALDILKDPKLLKALNHFLHYENQNIVPLRVLRGGLYKLLPEEKCRISSDIADIVINTTKDLMETPGHELQDDGNYPITAADLLNCMIAFCDNENTKELLISRGLPKIIPTILRTGAHGEVTKVSTLLLRLSLERRKEPVGDDLLSAIEQTARSSARCAGDAVEILHTVLWNVNVAGLDHEAYFTSKIPGLASDENDLQACLQLAMENPHLQTILRCGIDVVLASKQKDVNKTEFQLVILNTLYYSYLELSEWQHEAISQMYALISFGEASYTFYKDKLKNLGVERFSDIIEKEVSQTTKKDLTSIKILQNVWGSMIHGCTMFGERAAKAGILIEVINDVKKLANTASKNLNDCWYLGWAVSVLVGFGSVNQAQEMFKNNGVHSTLERLLTLKLPDNVTVQILNTLMAILDETQYVLLEKHSNVFKMVNRVIEESIDTSEQSVSVGDDHGNKQIRTPVATLMTSLNAVSTNDQVGYMLLNNGALSMVTSVLSKGDLTAVSQAADMLLKLSLVEYRCDACVGSISAVRGIRYRCSVREDYDLCGDCHQKGENSGHDMVKIAAWDVGIFEEFAKAYSKESAGSSDETLIRDGILCALKATVWNLEITQPKHEDVLQLWLNKHVQDDNIRLVCLQYIRLAPGMLLFFRSATECVDILSKPDSSLDEVTTAIQVMRKMGKFFVNKEFNPLFLEFSAHVGFCEASHAFYTNQLKALRLDVVSDVPRQNAPALLQTILKIWEIGIASSEAFANHASSSGVLNIVIGSMRHFASLAGEVLMKSAVFRTTCAITTNIVTRFPDNRQLYKDLKVVQTLVDFLKYKSQPDIIVMALMIISKIVEEDQYHLLSSPDDGVFEMFIEGIKAALQDENYMYLTQLGNSYHLCMFVEGLAGLSKNDEVKAVLPKKGVEGILPDVLTHLHKGAIYTVEQSRTVAAGAQLLWELSFLDGNKPQLKGNKLVMEAVETTLKQLQVETRKWEVYRKENGSLDPRINKIEELQKDAIKALEGVTWNLKTKEVEEEDTLTSKGHVMISYNWGDQKMLKRVHDALVFEGFKVWMDVNEMSGNTLEAMAGAVEGSSVVLVCFSEKYKLSQNCRMEADYAHQRKVPIIPLKMQRDYRPDGWLGFLIGTKLFFEFTDKYPFEQKMQELIVEVKRMIALSPKK